MALTTRRQFLQQATFAAAALYRHPIHARPGAQGVSAARKSNAASVDPAAIRMLASTISGPHNHDGSTRVRIVPNGVHPRIRSASAVIVRCAGASDSRVLDFAQTRNLPLTVRGGGHSRAGSSVCNGGVVIDFSGMKRVEVDADKHVARAEGGSLVGRFGRHTGSDWPRLLTVALM